MTAHQLGEPGDYPAGWTLGGELWDILQSAPRPRALFRFLEAGGEAREFSQRDLVRAAAYTGKGLVEAGVKPGEPVGVILGENLDFVHAFLGAVMMGCVPVPLFPPLGFGGLDAYVDRNTRILQACGARVLITSQRLQKVLWSMVSRIETLEQIVCIEDLRAASSPGGSTGRKPTATHTRSASTDSAGLDDLLALRPEVSAQDLCFLQYTSGSTAAPKGVMVPHKSLGANLFAVIHHGLKVDPEHTESVSWLPLFHDMGLIGMMLGPLCSGMPANFIAPLDFLMYPECWLEAISERRATATFAPNFAYAMAVRKISPEKVTELDLSSLRFAGCGAEPIHPETMRAFIEHFRPANISPTVMLPAYGMAEATLAMSFIDAAEPIRIDHIDAEIYENQGRAEPATPGRQAHEFVCCGRTFPEHELQIVDENRRPLPERHVGEVRFRGPSVAAGYFGDPAMTEAIFTPAGLLTGDLGYLADGQLYVTGRKKDLIIIHGRNFDPQTIEWAVAEVDGIRKGNVVAFSVPGESSEELVVVAETRANVDAEALAREVKRAVSHELRIKVSAVKLVPRATLPKTSSGKLQRDKTRRQYLENQVGHSMRAASQSIDVATVGRLITLSILNRMRYRIRQRMDRVAAAFRTLSSSDGW